MKGRPPTKRMQPSLSPSPFDVLKNPAFLAKIKGSLEDKVQRERRAIREASEKFVKDDKAQKRTRVSYASEENDPLRAAVYEQTFLKTVPVGASVRDEAGHISYSPIDKTSDSPLNYLFGRVEKRNRIDSVQYAAGVRYREDVVALAKVGSNTAATIEHLIMAPTLTPEDRWKQLNGVEFMRGGDDSSSQTDPTASILASVYRVRRVEDRLEVWELSILRDLLILENPIGKIATRWGIAPEAASVMARMALWKLARIMENTDKEFQAWLAVERQLIGEAKQ